MIAFLRGRVAGLDATSAVIDVGGVGYKVLLSTQSLAAVNGKDGEVTVLTSMIMREDSVTLYGFMNEQEKHLFERLITVSGVGPKVALSALSTFSAAVLQHVIVDEDVARVSTIPGIGKKTAQRIILELRGVLDAREPAGADASAPLGAAATAQATEALLGMGFTAAEVSLALKGYKGGGADGVDSAEAGTGGTGGAGGTAGAGATGAGATDSGAAEKDGRVAGVAADDVGALVRYGLRRLGAS
jgi:Holliday junction DNA helicase RuvA